MGIILTGQYAKQIGYEPKKRGNWQTIKDRDRELSKKKQKELQNIPKHERPAPETYLSEEYIEKHIDMFDDGGSIFITKDQYENYFKGVPEIGREDNSIFVLPKGVCDEIIDEAMQCKTYEEAISKIETELGFDSGYYAGKELVRVDIKDLSGLNLRIPSGNEAGANSYWIPGGFTSGNIAEAVANKVPQERVTYTLLDDLLNKR